MMIHNYSNNDIKVNDDNTVRDMFNISFYNFLDF